LNWPWQRFEELYEAYMKRSLVERLETRKEMMVAALWANSGFEGNEGASARNNAIEELENQFSEVAHQIYHGFHENEVPTDNQFWAAANKGVKQIEAPRNDEGVIVGEVVKYDIDQ
jgi:hypothetical protein